MTDVDIADLQDTIIGLRADLAKSVRLAASVASECQRLRAALERIVSREPLKLEGGCRNPETHMCQSCARGSHSPDLIQHTEDCDYAIAREALEIDPPS